MTLKPEKSNARFYTLLVFTLTCFVAAYLLNAGYEESQFDFHAKSKQFQSQFSSLLKKTEAFNDIVKENIEKQRFKNIDQCIPPYNIHHLDDSWYSILVLKGDSLIFWNNNKIPIQALDYRKLQHNEVLYLYNGWYYISNYVAGNYRVISFSCLKTEYKITNDLLQSEFQPLLFTNSEVKLSKGRAALNTFPVYHNGKFLFSLNYENVPLETPSIVPILYFIGILCLLFYLYEFLSYMRRRSPLAVYGILTLLLIGRIIMYVFAIPQGLYSLELFDPVLYAGYYSLRSLGDLLLSILVLVFWMIFIYQDIASIRISPRYTRGKVFYALILSPAFLVSFLYSTLIHYLQYSLIFNSKISLEVNNLFELNWYSYTVMFIVFVLMFSYFLLTDAIIKSVIGSYRDYKFHMVVLLAAMACFLVFVNYCLPEEIYRTYDYTTFILAISVIVLLYVFRNRNSKLFSFLSAFTVIILFSVYTAYLVNNLNREKELEQRIFIASRIAENKDPVAEYLFSESMGKQNDDRLLVSYFDEMITADAAEKSVLPARISQRINQLYFSDAYWSKYDIDMYVYDSVGSALLNANNNAEYSMAQLYGMVDTLNNITGVQGLYQLLNTTSRNAYLADVKVVDSEMDSNIRGHVFALMREKLGATKKGFPQLLEREKSQAVRSSSYDKYSWAFYRNGLLIDRGGTFGFEDNLANYTNITSPRNTYYIEKNDILYLVYKITAADVLLITLSENTRFKLFTEATYWFTFFFVLFLLFWLALRLLRKNLDIELSFKNRIQISVMTIVVLSMVLIAGFTVFFINGNYKKNQQTQLLDKLSSLELVIQNEFNTNITPDLSMDFTSGKLSQIANAMSSDFNIYNTHGFKVYSTKPTLFSFNIIGNMMNREAYNKLKPNANNSFVHPERIGRLQYLSSYTGLYDDEGRLMAYLNLPYITDPDELKNQISQFIITLINIYVPLFLLCLILTFFSANQLAKPLQTLQKSMAKVRLGKATEPIEWENSDEIGALIKQYNKMVNELALSANKLARSERESAWREMAKQVAHEIKNPLTPMKLSVQHLQRAWQDQNPNLHQIVPRLSASIIEQIDTLSAIATEFSNFAKMPTAQFTVVELNSIFKSSADLFAKEGNITIEYLVPDTAVYKVFADKDQLLRVFSNLLKNALQAIPEQVNGHILLNIEKIRNQYLVSINDNGKGISAEEQAKIFVPYFTTKSFGTGLGLAIVKNIVEAANGSIWFESEVGKGTTFFVQLPAFEDPIA